MFKISVICYYIFLLLIPMNCSIHRNQTQDKVIDILNVEDYSTESKDFVTVWSVDATEEIELPLENNGSYQFTVQWGDGSDPEKVSSYDSPHVKHRYVKSGRYKVTITGQLDGWGNSRLLEIPQLIEVESWGSMQFGNQGYFFTNANHLEALPNNPPNLANITNMEYMFSGATAFSQNLNSWDVSAVTNMTSMFNGATIFNGNISSWNVIAVTQMSLMFKNAVAFNQDIGDWRVGSVKSILSMFYNASSFNKDISGWNVSSVKNMSTVFQGADSFSDANKDKIKASSTWSRKPF